MVGRRSCGDWPTAMSRFCARCLAATSAQSVASLAVEWMTPPPPPPPDSSASLLLVFA